jgi:hypothetical protein
MSIQPTSLDVDRKKIIEENMDGLSTGNEIESDTDVVERLTDILDDNINNQIPLGYDESSLENLTPLSQDADGGLSCPGTAPTTTRENTIAQKESREVRRYKIIVLIMIFGTSLVVAVFVRYFIQWCERINFEDHFKESAAIVLEGVGNSITRTLIPLDSISISTVSYARALNNTWPYVTVPNYAIQMAKAMPLTDAVVIQYGPIVQPEQRTQWELYASQHNQWVNESIRLQDSWDKYTGPIIYDWEPNDKIFSDFGDMESNVRFVQN